MSVKKLKVQQTNQNLRLKFFYPSLSSSTVAASDSSSISVYSLKATKSPNPPWKDDSCLISNDC